MEAIFFLIDIIGIIMLLYWSIQNDRLGPDAPTVGLFSYRKSITKYRRVPGKRGQRPEPRGRR